MSEKMVPVTDPAENEQAEAEVAGLGEFNENELTKDEIAARWRASRREAAVAQQRAVLLRRQTEALARLHAGITELEQLNGEIEALEDEQLADDSPAGQLSDSPGAGSVGAATDGSR